MCFIEKSGISTSHRIKMHKSKEVSSLVVLKVLGEGENICSLSP